MYNKQKINGTLGRNAGFSGSLKTGLTVCSKPVIKQIIIFTVGHSISDANNHLYVLIWGKDKAWNGTPYDTPYNLLKNCKEKVGKDIAIVNIHISSETFIRTIRDRRVTFAGTIATLGNRVK